MTKDKNTSETLAQALRESTAPISVASIDDLAEEIAEAVAEAVVEAVVDAMDNLARKNAFEAQIDQVRLGRVPQVALTKMARAITASAVLVGAMSEDEVTEEIAAARAARRTQ